MRVIVLSSLFLLAVACALTFVTLAQRTDASSDGPEMALGVEGPGVVCEPQDTERCVVPRGGEFLLTVDVVQAPESGYTLFQTNIDFGQQLIYHPRQSAADEVVWPACNARVATRGMGSSKIARHACLTGLEQPKPTSSFVGRVLELDFECSSQESTSVVALVPIQPNFGTDGAAFVEADGRTIVVPKVNSVEVDCVGEAPKPEIALRMEGRGVVCKQDDEVETCTIPRSAPFALAVDAAHAPEEGYVLVQVAIDYGPDLRYQPRATRSEILWPDCVPPARLLILPVPHLLTKACLTGLLPPLPASHYEGPLFEFDFACPEVERTTTVALVPLGDPPAGVDGTMFALPDGVTQVVPKVDSIEVVCTGEPLPTFTPTATPTPAATLGPTPVVFPGDADKDGQLTSLDAHLILQYEAGLLGSGHLPNGDVSGDGVVDSRDAAIVLQFIAGLVPRPAP